MTEGKLGNELDFDLLYSTHDLLLLSHLKLKSHVLLWTHKTKRPLAGVCLRDYGMEDWFWMKGGNFYYTTTC